MTPESSSSLDEASTAHSPTATSGATTHSTETTSSNPAPVDAGPEEPTSVGTLGTADTLDAVGTLDAAAHTHTITSDPTTPAPIDTTPEEPATASFPLIATASVPTQRAARYGKQLVSHMVHKITGAWDEETANGYLLFDREGPVLGRFDVIASPSALRLELRTTPERAAHLEHVAGIHLARFGVRDGLAIAWERTDGSEGSVQGPLTPEEVAAHARAKKARAAAREAGHAAEHAAQ
ncbi:DUF2218 domain-containing protein [uncultured Actinomyces sp.]|uniref:DUF2218 domain-containing protein n=1 Tax=uncultured Actinomyces sp. TaxID=249061 RepID=UPI0028EAB91E|nr:DUF2218 domain-containing protein [uncultured Actinomyces sp.]